MPAWRAPRARASSPRSTRPDVTRSSSSFSTTNGDMGPPGGFPCRIGKDPAQRTARGSVDGGIFRDLPGIHGGCKGSADGGRAEGEPGWPSCCRDGVRDPYPFRLRAIFSAMSAATVGPAGFPRSRMKGSPAATTPSSRTRR